MSRTRTLISSALDFVEKRGNKLPDPIALFVLLAIGVVVISAILNAFGVSVQHPNGSTIAVKSLLSAEMIQKMFTDMVSNFANFPPLGLVLVTIIGIGLAEQSGYVNASLKRLVTAVPGKLLTATLVFAGIMSNLAADAGYVVLVPLGAVLFASVGRHPIAGLAAGFSGVSGGFSANLLITGLDPLLGGISQESARLLDPSYEVLASANYYFMLASTLFLVLIGTWVTEKVVEPRLGKWTPPEGLKIDTSLGELAPKEKRALKFANISFILLCAIVALATLPEGAIFRDADGTTKPFFHSLVPIITVIFLVCGLVYGVVAGTIKNDKDASKMAGDQMTTMGSYIVLAFAAAQFIAYFKWSNLGMVVAISGAGFLKVIGLSGVPLLLSFILVTSIINIFIGSASAKWAIMGPVFVPMFMLMGYSPEIIQNSYRIGDSVTNIISPLMPYFPIIIAFAQKYSPKVGLGTLVATMLPYSAAFLLFWSLLLSLWFAFGIPVGPGAPIHIPIPGQ